MSVTSKKLRQLTFEDIPSIIFSQESADGLSPCDSPDGPMIGPSLLAVVRASRTRWRGGKKATRTSEICGPLLPPSSEASDLSQSLASKCQALLGMGGSIEYTTTWKRKVTKSGRSYYQLVASVPRSSGSDCSGWSAPGAEDAERNPSSQQEHRTHRPSGCKRQVNLNDAAAITPWVAPTATDGQRGALPPRETDTGVPLDQMASLVPWNAPRATDGTNGGPNQAGGALPADAALCPWAAPAARDTKSDHATDEFNRQRDMHPRGKPLTYQVLGVITQSSDAETANPAGLALNAAHSRWLMGYPVEWDHLSPHWKEWELIQSLLTQSHGVGESFWTKLAKIVLADSRATETPSCRK